jgi:hypothetical protein
MYQAASQGTPVDPIISRLRPRTVGEVLDQAFRLYRRHFLTFIGIIAVVVVPLQLAQQTIVVFLIGGLANYETDPFTGGFSTGSSTNYNEVFSYIGILGALSVLIGLIAALLQSLAQGALTGEVANSHLDKPVSFSDAYRQMFARLGPLLGVIFLQIGIVLLILLPIILLTTITFSVGIGSALNGSNDNSGFLGLFCFSCLLIIPAGVLLAYVFIRLLVVTPAVMVEHLGPVQAIRRSWGLVKDYWWRTFALSLVLAILAYVVQAGPAFIVQSIVALFTPRNLVLQQVVSGVVTVFTTLVFIPIQLIAITLYYFDLRVRKEGYDIETAMAQRYSMTPPPPPPAWTGAGYGQSNPTTPIMPPPSLGQGYGYDYGQYEQGAPTQPVADEYPERMVDSGPATDDLSKQ